MESTRALRFIILLGVVSLFSDVTYQGARSITGPYLQVLGATAALVAIVAGLGELIGYALRLLSGFVTERTGGYWAVAFLGYLINLIAVPMMGVVPGWKAVACLMLFERLGKAVRTPARDAMLSYATSQTGHGWGFGLHEFLDQIGAVLGPLAIAWAMQAGRGYPLAFKLLGIPAGAALVALFVSSALFPHPKRLENEATPLEGEALPTCFWWYLLASAFVAAGYADFPLIAFHLKKNAIVSAATIPLLYALAMASDAVAALFFGRWFDRRGLGVLALAIAGSAAFGPLVFFGSGKMLALGVAVWGIGMGAQESILRAAVAKMVSRERRASSFGIFNAGYGVAWFAGSALMGILYDRSLPALVAFSIISQGIGLALLLRQRPQFPQ